MKPFRLDQLLELAALEDGDAVAVVDREREITYADLDRRANQVAHALLAAGITRGDRVAIYLDKSLESVIGIYGTLRAGAGYVPLDPSAPTPRLDYILRNCGVKVLLTGAEKASAWPEFTGGDSPVRTVVVLNGEWDPVTSMSGDVAYLGVGELASLPVTAPANASIGLDLAYILYTSGSTGHPKGVMLSHQNALAFVDWAVLQFQVQSSDRLSSHAPFHFDLSVFDLFAAAAARAQVVLVPPRTSLFPIEVRRFIESQGITIWYSVPSALTALALRGQLQAGDLPCLRTILFAGEVFPTKYLRELMSRLPHVGFANLYGPTETNVCSWYEVPVLPEAHGDPIPIGRAIGGVEMFAMTDAGLPAPQGTLGELLVRGPTVMLGYWDDAERTRQALIVDPLARGVPDCAYRTGDLVEELPDGNFRFLGRRDSQIKSRGYRIELGDIESAFDAHPGIVECAAVAVPDDLVTNRIRLFVVVNDEISDSDLMRFCADRIPKYMIPEEILFQDKLPRTSTGKVDRQSLLERATKSVRDP